jgi:hypothetical protein
VNDLVSNNTDPKREHDYEIVLKPPEVASFSPEINTLVDGAWLREKGLCPERVKDFRTAKA